MRPALEYASYIWLHLAYSTSMYNSTLRTATGCTRDTNIHHLHDETLIFPIHEHLQLHAPQYKQHHIHHIQHISTLQCETHYIFNHGRYPTNIPTYPHTFITTDIKTNMHHIHTYIVSRYLATRDCKKYCADLHLTLTTLKRYFAASLVSLLPNSEQINHPSSNHTYTKSTPKHIHHQYAPSVTLTHTTHIIS